MLGDGFWSNFSAADSLTIMRMILNNKQNATNLLFGGYLTWADRLASLLQMQKNAEKSRKRHAPCGMRLLHSSYNPHTYTARTHHANYTKARI